MSIFNQAIRIVNKHETPLPVTKLSQEPSAFDTGDSAIKTSLTYVLEKDAKFFIPINEWMIRSITKCHT